MTGKTEIVRLASGRLVRGRVVGGLPDVGPVLVAWAGIEAWGRPVRLAEIPGIEREGADG